MADLGNQFGVVQPQSGLLQQALDWYQKNVPNDSLTQTPQGGVGYGQGPSIPQNGWDVAGQLSGPLLGAILGHVMNIPRGFRSIPEAAPVEPEVNRIPLDQIINSRDSMYHATDLDGFHGIMGSGKILPSEGGMTVNGEHWATVDSGVSMSRIPRVASKGSKAISFVLDPKELGASRPYTEPVYEKTTEYPRMGWAGLGEIAQPSSMNSKFEFENRTYGTPVNLQSPQVPGAIGAGPSKAIKGVLVDKSALTKLIEANPSKYWPDGIPEPPLKNANNIRGLVNYHLGEIEKATQAKGIPFRAVENGREMTSYRARFSKMASEGQALWSLPIAAGVAATPDNKDSQGK